MRRLPGLQGEVLWKAGQGLLRTPWALRWEAVGSAI